MLGLFYQNLKEWLTCKLFKKKAKLLDFINYIIFLII